MNRSYSKIRHIQESNRILENRLLNEQSTSVYKKYPKYHDKDGNMIGELGKMEEYVMATWRKREDESSFGLEPKSTEDTYSITNAGRKIVWDFKQNKIFFEKDLKFDPNPLPLSSNFNAFQTWFDKNDQQSTVSDLGWMAKSVVKQGLGLE